MRNYKVIKNELLELLDTLRKKDETHNSMYRLKEHVSGDYFFNEPEVLERKQTATSVSLTTGWVSHTDEWLNYELNYEFRVPFTKNVDYTSIRFNNKDDALKVYGLLVEMIKNKKVE